MAIYLWGGTEDLVGRASGAIDRSTAKSADQQRYGSADLLRDVQCAGTLYVDSGCVIIVCGPFVNCMETRFANSTDRYASGRTTGIVLDSGDGVSHAVPVYEGFAMPSAIRRIDVAGRDVTENLQILLRKAGAVFHTSAEKEVVRLIKEKTCFIALDPRKEEKEWAGGGASRVEEYKLPDGNTLKLGSERFRAPEILFDPELIGLEYPGIHQIVVDAINRTDMDLRKSLFGNIVLSGGSTLTKGFGDRLLSEVRRLAVKDMKIKIFAPPERKYSTWIGGSILAGLSTFRKMWVSIDDWHENPEVIHTKFS
jgi:centractin